MGIKMKNQIQIIKKYSEGISFEEALKLAEKEGKHLASNLEIDNILKDETLRTQYKDLFPCYTGDIIAYPKQGEAFGKYIKDSSSGVIIDVPKEYQGLKGKALFLQHPNYSLSKADYDMTFIKPNKGYKIMCIDFPERDGWYLPDQFGIPNGDKSSESDKNARYLWRKYSSDSVRPVSRVGFFGFDYRRVVDCYYDFYIRLGVVLSSPSKAAKTTKKKAK